MKLNSLGIRLLLNVLLINFALGKKKDGAPPTVKALEGDTISLSCDKSVSTDTLYAVKWYKDEKEFFRNYPRREENQVKIDPIDGFTIEESSASSPWQVVLKDVKESASGKYTCMVVDYPRYRTIYRSTHVEVTPKNVTLHQQHPPDMSGTYRSRGESSIQRINSFQAYLLYTTCTLILVFNVVG